MVVDKLHQRILLRNWRARNFGERDFVNLYPTMLITVTCLVGGRGLCWDAGGKTAKSQQVPVLVKKLVCRALSCCMARGCLVRTTS